jgi:hypothetical protein
MTSDFGDVPVRQPGYEVGYRRPPVRTRFKPGVSGNPSGRPKGSPNLQTLFNKILKEQVSLREGAEVRKVSKAEAILRGLVVGAMKGDQRSVMTLFRIAEQTGQFDQPVAPVSRIVVSWLSDKHREADGLADDDGRGRKALPANSKLNREWP